MLSLNEGEVGRVCNTFCFSKFVYNMECNGVGAIFMSMKRAVSLVLSFMYNCIYIVNIIMMLGRRLR